MPDPQNKLIEVFANIVSSLLPLPLGVVIGIILNRYLSFKNKWTSIVLVSFVSLILIPTLLILFGFARTELFFPGRYGWGFILILILIPPLFSFSVITFITKILSRYNEITRLFVFIIGFIIIAPVFLYIAFYVWGKYLQFI